MKWIYVLTWITVEVWSGSPPPAVSEYGITSQFINAVAIYYSDSTAHRRTFDTRADADTFRAHAPGPLASMSWMSSHTTAWHLDSVLVDTAMPWGVVEILLDSVTVPMMDTTFQHAPEEVFIEED